MLRGPFAEATAHLPYDTRALLVWLFAEVQRRDRRRPGRLTLPITVAELAEELLPGAHGWHRVARMLEELSAAGHITWQPAGHGRPGRLTVDAYARLVPDGRRELGSGYHELYLDRLEELRDRLGFDTWAAATVATLAAEWPTAPIAAPTGRALADRLGMAWRTFQRIAAHLAAEELATLEGNVRGTATAALTVEGAYLAVVKMTQTTARPSATGARSSATGARPSAAAPAETPPTPRPCNPPPQVSRSLTRAATPPDEERAQQGGQLRTEEGRLAAVALAERLPTLAGRLLPSRPSAKQRADLARLGAPVAAGWTPDEVATVLASRIDPARVDHPLAVAAKLADELKTQEPPAVRRARDAARIAAQQAALDAQRIAGEQARTRSRGHRARLEDLSELHPAGYANLRHRAEAELRAETGLSARYPTPGPLLEARMYALSLAGLDTCAAAAGAAEVTLAGTG